MSGRSYGNRQITSSGHGTRGILSSGHGTKNVLSSGYGTGGFSGVMHGYSAQKNYGGAGSYGFDNGNGWGRDRQILSSGFGTNNARSQGGNAYAWGHDRQILSSGFGTNNLTSSGYGTNNRGGQKSAWGTGGHFGGQSSTFGHGQGFFQSAYSLGQNTSRSGQGTGHGFHGTGGDRTWGTYGYGGAGVGLGPLGGGLAGGGGQWTQDGRKADGSGRYSEGYGGGGGLVGSARLGNQNFHAGTDVYTGVGGNAYSFQGDGERGFGLDGSYTKLGFQNAEVGTSTFLGDYNAKVGDVGIGRMYGGVEGGQRDDGTYFGRSSFAPNRTEVRDVELSSSNFTGDTKASLDSFGTGPRHEVNTYVNPDTGAFGGGYAWQGGGWKAEGANVEHSFSDTERVTGSVAKIDTSNSYNLNVGYDPETGLVADGNYSTGNTIEDAKVGVETRYGTAHGQVGKYSDGNSIENGTASLGRDGLNASAEKFGYNNRSVENVELGWEAFGMSETATLDKYDSGLRGENLSAHVGLDGYSVKGDAITYNQHAIEGFNARREIEGLGTQEFGVGSASYNHAHAKDFSSSVGPDGIHQTLGEGAYSKVAVDNVTGSLDLGEYGRADGSIDHFGMNDFKIAGAENHITANGANGKIDSASFQQYGIQGVEGNASFFDGAVKGNANLDNAAVNQASIEGARYNLDENGLTAGLDKADYSYVGIDGLNVQSDIAGLRSGLQLDHGGMHDASIENLNYSVDREGTTRTSFDNASYDYFGVEGFKSETDAFGVVGQSVELGKGSFAGGDIGHFESESNWMKGTSSATVEGLNAHALALEDAKVTQSVGDASASLGAEKLDLVDLDVGRAELNTADWGTRGNASVEDVDYKALDAEGVGLGLGWNGEEVASARLNADAGYKMKSGEADWNLQTGDVSTKVEDLNAGAHLGGDFSLAGHQLHVPKVGGELNMDAATNGNLYDARSQGQMNFAGTNLDLGFTKLEAGENARVGWDADLNVGSDWDKSNLDITVGNTTIDVDQGIRDGVNTVKETAGNVVEGGRQLVNDGIETAGNLYEGGKQLVGDGIDAVGNGLSAGVDAVGTGLDTAKNWAGGKIGGAKKAVGNFLSSWGW